MLRRLSRPAALSALLLGLQALDGGAQSSGAQLSGTPPSGLGLPEGHRLVYRQAFDRAPALGELLFSDSAAWRFAPGRAGEPGSLELVGGSGYSPLYRSPLNIALVRDLWLGDFVMEVEALQTGREYGHRDLCFFFGFENAARFYYVHLATTPDERAHNIFLVDGAARRPTAEVPRSGVDWGTGEWRQMRIERSLGEGSIRVFFDGREVLEATDRTVGWGRVGVGSFDDSGRFRNLQVWAPEVRAAEPSPFGG